MIKQTPVTQVLHKTEKNWPESHQEISPEILRIYRINDYLRQNVQIVLDNFGLQAADFAVLETLRKEPAPHCLTPTELSTAMLFSSGGLTKVLHRMTNVGYITRIHNPHDKRGKLVQLTESGGTLINEVIVKLHSQEQSIMTALSTHEKTALNQLLEKLLNVWEE
ncbi:MarR family transcriptional regulator [Neptunomonas phycophila]|uniref:MarR family winged helix-turn-helix transcriptional regulator n=1 Tax=Neptunomonas phycophila TaxID=1572645 RepID=UPI0026E2DDA3|nr:MarR family transcriptional regulator [Neptunomonas phycophila]MDO6469528.1 MarR family transcriptional regulator [Neptunomonas phycophila]